MPLGGARGGADTSLIELLQRPHGDKKHVVTFSRKPMLWGESEAGWEEMCAIPVDELSQWFPQIRADLEEFDSYSSVNGFVRSSKRSHAHPGLPRSTRKNELLRYLTACYVDLDTYSVGLSPCHAVRELFSAWSQGDVPLPSLILDSGRGLWGFWLLAEEGEERAGVPLRAWPENVRLWSRAQHAIHRRFARVGADANAMDAARVARIPGTINSKSQTPVTFDVLAVDEDDRPRAYTLSEMADCLGVHIPKRRAASMLSNIDLALVPPRQEKLAGSHPGRALLGRAGRLGRWWLDLKRFEAVWTLRGSFEIGTRNSALFIYSRILVSLHAAARACDGLDERDDDEARRLREYRGKSIDDLREDVRELALDCAPGQGFSPRRDADAAFDQVMREKLCIRHSTIASRLNITEDEAAAIAEAVPRGRGWPASSGVRPTEPESRSSLRKRRRFAIDVIVRQAGGVPPTLEAIVEQLAERGISTTIPTVSQDLKALGIANPRGKAEKARRRPTLFPEGKRVVA